ncbi:MAG TPA: serine/threonine-protein kinase [Vicinamibacteria bacterium]|nr:serine/threonine-protein kinase [Vicinamibacteria bacterium]
MAKNDGNPFTRGVRYEEVLGVDRSKVRERIRRREEAQAGEPLLTATDLFGDIIEGFRDGSDASSDSRETSVRRAVTEADTDPYPRAVESYSLLDAAYATLGNDPRSHRATERHEEASGTRSDGSTDFGRYRLMERIATGGMAEVFRAKQEGVEGFEKIVAVKKILPHLASNKGFVEMFIAEAKMVASLSHPNIVHIFDLGKIGESYYIAMEFIEGRDLKSILTRARDRGSLIGVDLAALVASKVGAALEAAHSHRDGNGVELGIVHRDVSPQNILVSNDGEVKLADFGIAKAACKASHTDSGSLRGKLLYMSPEQAWGRPVDRCSDLFSLGAVFFEMLTGHLLFSGNSELGILERVREGRFLLPSSLNPAVPIELESIVTRLLRKEPKDRYQSAAEMLADLDSYLRRRPAVGPNELKRFVAQLFEMNPS